jgi:hypothetical protein
MERDGQPVVVERAGKLFTLRPPKARRRKKTGIILPDDPLWELAGAGSSGAPGNHVSRDTHRYIAGAIAAHSTIGKRQTRADDDDSTPREDKPAPSDPA